MQRKAYIASGAFLSAIVTMFSNRGFTIVDNLQDADLLVLTGGADVSPVRYGEHPHPSTYADFNRDVKEMKLYETALAMGIPMAGICRGAQLMNVLNGGKLWQDVNNHGIGGTHTAYMVGNLIPVEVSSTHHQMMRPNSSPEKGMQILLTAKESARYRGMTELSDKDSREIIYHPNQGAKEDIECVYYEQTNCLCYQPHPEYSVMYGKQYKECADIFFNWIDELLFDAKHS